MQNQEFRDANRERDGMPEDRREISDVVREETSRGSRRRPVDTEARKQRERLRQDYLKVIRDGDEEDFLTVLRALGLQEGSEEFRMHLKTWRQIRQSRQRRGGRRGA